MQVTGQVQPALADSDLVGESEPNATRALAVQALYTPPPSVLRCVVGACIGMQGGIEACIPVRCLRKPMTSVDVLLALAGLSIQGPLRMAPELVRPPWAR